MSGIFRLGEQEDFRASDEIIDESYQTEVPESAKTYDLIWRMSCAG